MSGGPCLDMFGNLIGLAFAKEDISFGRLRFAKDLTAPREYRSSTIVVSTDEMLEFLEAAIPDFKPEAERGNAFQTAQQVADSIRESIIVVKSWKKDPRIARKIARDEALDRIRKRAPIGGGSRSIANIREKGIFPDVWCMACKATGKFHCLNCSGKGKVAVQKRVRVPGSYDAQGSPMYRHELQPQTCPICRGIATRDCQDCVDGKLPLR